MISVEWSSLAEQDLEHVLRHAASPAGARTIRHRIKNAEKAIATFPHAATYDE